MTRSRLTALGAVVVLVAAVVWWIGNDDEGVAAVACSPSEIPEHDETTLVVEGDAWSGYAPFRDETLMDGSGYSLLYVEQVCQDVRAADLTAGRADIAVTSLDQYLLNNPDGTVVGIIDQSVGADALVLGTGNHDDLDNIDDIPALVEQLASQGQRPKLAYTANSPSEMLLNELANSAEEIRLADFELVPVDQSATAFEMLQDDEVQLAVVWEPETSAARAAGHTITLSSANVPHSIVDVIVASDRLIERDPDAVQAVVTAFYTRMDSYLADPDALRAFYAEDGQLEPEAAQQLIAGIQLYGTADAAAYLNNEVFPLDKALMQQSVESIESLLALIHPEMPLGQAQIDGIYVGNVALRSQRPTTPPPQPPADEEEPAP
jgi:ABC-type nitrate/sulfonate/bicarbonate transport system substrate-binding protein